MKYIEYEWRLTQLKMGLALAFILAVIGGFMVGYAWSREGDDHGNHGALKAWFDQLASQRGLCCSFADGELISDAQWDTKDDHYRVYLDNHWIDVPGSAVVTVPNKFGQAVVWPLRYDGKVYDIRCFMPGAGT